MSYEKYKDFRLAPDDNGCWSVLTADTYEGRGTFPSKAAAKRFIDENTPPSTPPEEVELENLLNNLADEIMTEFDHTNCQPELQRAKAKLLRWREAYADKARERQIKWFIGTLEHNSYKDTINLANIQLAALRKVNEEDT